MATVGRQTKQLSHDRLPLWSVRSYARAEDLVGDQVRCFVGHGLQQKIIGVVTVHLAIETQQVLVQISDASTLPAQIEFDVRAGKVTVEVLLGKLIAAFKAGKYTIHLRSITL